MRLHGGQYSVESALAERAHLLQRTGLEHRIETSIDAAVELRPVGVEKDLDRAVGGDCGFHAFAVPVGDGAPGRQDHLERAGDAGAITGPETLRRRRIAIAEFGIERRDALGFEPVPDG